MKRYLAVVVFFCSINCFSYNPLNCLSSRDNLSTAVSNLIKNVCSISELNNINFITNISNVTLNNMVRKGYFFIIDTGENLIYMPYKLYKEIILILGSYGDTLLEKSSLSPIPKEQWIAEATNKSSLIELPLDYVNCAFFNNHQFSDSLSISTKSLLIGLGGGAGLFAIIVIVVCVGCVCDCCGSKDAKSKDIINQKRMERTRLKNKDHLKPKPKFYDNNMCTSEL